MFTREQSGSESDPTKPSDNLHFEVIGRLALNVAHDLNNMLTVVVATVERIRRQLQECKGETDDIQAMEQAAETASGIAQSLLSCYRRGPSRFEKIDMGEFVKSAARLLRCVLPNTISLGVEADASSSGLVRADRVQLHQVLMNLSLNARDAMPKGGDLRLTVRSMNGLVSLSVSDTGGFTMKPGIPEPGRGLGLGIVRRIVTAHLGHLEVSPRNGGGTTYTIVLPRVIEAGGRG